MRLDAKTGEVVPETMDEVSRMVHESRKYSKKGSVIEWYRRSEVDQMVHDAYCAGANDVDPLHPDSKPGFNTPVGSLALKAALWCKLIGTR